MEAVLNGSPIAYHSPCSINCLYSLRQQIRRDPVRCGNQCFHVGAFIVVRSIHAGADERQRHVAARAPEGLAIRAIVRINIRPERDRVPLRQITQCGAETMMIRPAAIFKAQRRMELVRLLALADGSHIHRNQLLHVCGYARRRSMPYFFIIAQVRNTKQGRKLYLHPNR